MTFNSNKIDEIIKAFEKWFVNDNHSKIEDFYKHILSYENISSLSQKEFEDIFLEFANDGGKIQSGGYRTAKKFIQNVHENFPVFRQRMLTPFQSDFDVTEWIRWSESFKYFGKGLATIYLNRVDKNKYIVVNNKSISAYTKLGFEVAKNPLEKTYNDLLAAQTEIILKYPEMKNFFRTDALAHFLIGTKEGLSFSEDFDNAISKIRNISKEDVKKAIERINNNPNLRKGRESIEYDLIYNNNKYPPILVLSEANKIAGGQELILSDFGNSTKNAFSILYSLGFIVDKKTISFSEYLNNFITQSENGILTTSGYLDRYEGLKVKVGFGQGNQARITWIAFLDEKNTVQNGIYPVYLYFKKQKKLILAYGVSETHIPSINWSLSDLKSISDYFSENQLGRPERYGNSFVYKIYNTYNPINPDEINSDLDNLIKFYKQELINQPRTDQIKQIVFNYKSFAEYSVNANLLLDKNIILRFISAVLTKPFVILTGLSGSGKTKLAQAFSNWICESDDQICLIPVGADWTNREPLLGFPNALEKNNYVKPDNGVLDLIIEANNNENIPYFLILDEMNLSHVERYFADFLSVMESKSQISLHSGNEDWNGVPVKIGLPKNLFIIGTVNIDETTYMFSPKVLDRANVIEFRVTVSEMESFLESNIQLNLEVLKGEGKNMAENFVQLAKESNLEFTDVEILNKTLMNFFAELKKTGAEFGYRSASEIIRFAAIAQKLDTVWNIDEIIDAAIMQKLLPKVHGSRKKLAPVLETLGSLCMAAKLNDGEKMENFLNPVDENNFTSRIKYPMSFEKISRMYRALLHNGFTSYAEA